MPLKIKDAYEMINEMAPFKEAYPWDNSGLILNVSEETRNILIALDLTEDIISQANKLNCGLIITHHPLIFESIKNINRDERQGALIIELIKNGISLICAHTNVDKAAGGINDFLADRLGLADVKALAEDVISYNKIVVFTPAGYEDNILKAAFDAGAGNIGNYSGCAFLGEGTGTFTPDKNAKPFLGKSGNTKKAGEKRLEIICEQSRLNEVISAVKKAHPYEEPAIDAYLLIKPDKKSGTGRIGSLNKEYSKKDFIAYVKKALNTDVLRASESSPEKIRKVAVCGGGGSQLLINAYNEGADAFITGEVKHSDYYRLKPKSMLIIQAGHFDTEACFSYIIFGGLQQRFNELKCNVNVYKAKQKRPYGFY